MTSHAPWSLAMLVLSLTMPTPALAWEERELDTTGASPVAHSLEQGGRARSTPGGIASEQMVALADARLEDAALEPNVRGRVLLARQLSLDCRKSGAQSAARLLGVRLVASYALAADTPQHIASGATGGGTAGGGNAGGTAGPAEPYTFFEGQLVFPNVSNRRQFWERVD